MDAPVPTRTLYKYLPCARDEVSVEPIDKDILPALVSTPTTKVPAGVVVAATPAPFVPEQILSNQHYQNKE